MNGETENIPCLGEKYEILEILGTGAMGRVFKARQLFVERFVAIKVISSELLDAPNALERFQREARLSARLSHPNIVQTYDVDRISGDRGTVTFIVSEFIDGPTLREFLSKTPVPDLRQTLRIIGQLCLGLNFAHKKGIIHRDVKPDNILLEDGGLVKIADFGIAREIEECSTVTRNGAMLGTPLYMAPEQITRCDNERLTPSVDIYATAVILYRMVTGSPPFSAEDPVQVLAKHVKERPVRPSLYNNSLPPELERLILKALAKTPAERQSSMAELFHEIDAVNRRLYGTSLLADSSGVFHLDDTCDLSAEDLALFHPCQAEGKKNGVGSPRGDTKIRQQGPMPSDRGKDNSREQPDFSQTRRNLIVCIVSVFFATLVYCGRGLLHKTDPPVSSTRLKTETAVNSHAASSIVVIEGPFFYPARNFADIDWTANGKLPDFPLHCMPRKLVERNIRARRWALGNGLYYYSCRCNRDDIIEKSFRRAGNSISVEMQIKSVENRPLASVVFDAETVADSFVGRVPFGIKQRRDFMNLLRQTNGELWRRAADNFSDEVKRQLKGQGASDHPRITCGPVIVDDRLLFSDEAGSLQAYIPAAGDDFRWNRFSKHDAALLKPCWYFMDPAENYNRIVGFGFDDTHIVCYASRSSVFECVGKHDFGGKENCSIFTSLRKDYNDWTDEHRDELYRARRNCDELFILNREKRLSRTCGKDDYPHLGLNQGRWKEKAKSIVIDGHDACPFTGRFNLAGYTICAPANSKFFILSELILNRDDERLVRSFEAYEPGLLERLQSDWDGDRIPAFVHHSLLCCRYKSGQDSALFTHLTSAVGKISHKPVLLDGTIYFCSTIAPAKRMDDIDHPLSRSRLTAVDTGTNAVWTLETRNSLQFTSIFLHPDGRRLFLSDTKTIFCLDHLLRKELAKERHKRKKTLVTRGILENARGEYTIPIEQVKRLLRRDKSNTIDKKAMLSTWIEQARFMTTPLVSSGSSGDDYLVIGLPCSEWIKESGCSLNAVGNRLSQYSRRDQPLISLYCFRLADHNIVEIVPASRWRRSRFNIGRTCDFRHAVHTDENTGLLLLLTGYGFSVLDLNSAPPRQILVYDQFIGPVAHACLWKNSVYFTDHDSTLSPGRIKRVSFSPSYIPGYIDSLRTSTD